MAKAKRILTFITAVMMLFALSIGFAGCDNRKDVTVYLYLTTSNDHVSFKEDMDSKIDGDGNRLLRQWSKEEAPDQNDPIVLYFSDVEGLYLKACYTSGSTFKEAGWYEPKTFLHEFGESTIATGSTCMAAIQKEPIFNTLPERTRSAYRIKEEGTYHFGFRITENDERYYPLWGSCKIIIEDC